MADRRPRSEEGENSGARGGGGSDLGALPVPFTCCFLPLCNVVDRGVVRQKPSVVEQKLRLVMISESAKVKMETFFG